MQNIYIRNLYAPGFSLITLSFYKTNLSISYAPWIGENEIGLHRYDTKNYVSTTINDENVAALYSLTQQILNGTMKNPCQYVIQCNKQAVILFEYDLEKTQLNIEKNGEKIPFIFTVHKYKEKVNGKVVEKTIQTGLIVFAEVLHTYMSAVAADRQMNKQLTGPFENETPSFPEWM